MPGKKKTKAEIFKEEVDDFIVRALRAKEFGKVSICVNIDFIVNTLKKLARKGRDFS